MDRLLDRLPELTDLELTLRRIVFGARLLGVGWMELLAGITLIQQPVLANWGWVWGVMTLGAIWAVVTVVLWSSRPDLLTSRFAILSDAVLATLGLLAPRMAGIAETAFYGGLPLIVVAIAAVRGKRTAWGMAALLVGVVLGARGVDTVAGLVESISQIIIYAAGAFIFSWVVGVLRRSERVRLAAQDAAAEAEAKRARAEERDQISRHLHDSVLQTLALIQRSCDRPADVVGLARRQERELREWLYGEPSRPDAGFAEALRQAAGDVEESLQVMLDVVVVGDVPDSASVAALVAASREAMLNAAKHSGVDQVSVYGEVADSVARVFVRDRGRGFDPGAIPADRRGISDSIRGRIGDVSGRAEIRSSPERGTEWRLEVPI